MELILQLNCFILVSEKQFKCQRYSGLSIDEQEFFLGGFVKHMIMNC